MKIIAFGLAAAKGSKKFVGMMTNKKTGEQFGALADQGATGLARWCRSVERAAKAAMNGAPALDGPLRVRMVFTMPKPKSAPKRRQTWPDKKPDIDKIVRSTCDALTKGKAYVDDARIVELTALKVFPNEHPESLGVPGVRIEIEGIA